MGINFKKISMKKLSLLVGIFAFSILVIVLVFILNFARKEKQKDVMKDVTRVGLILYGQGGDRSWNETHSASLERISEPLNLNVVTIEKIGNEEACRSAIKRLIDEEECEVIIGTSVEYGACFEQAAAEYPDRYFLCLAGDTVSGNLDSFFGRMYQVRYLSGIVAGLQSKTGHIGYVAAFPISELNRGINAFTLGVRSVAPDAVVHVSFCESWDSDEAAAHSAEKLITGYGTDVISMQVDSLSPMRVAEKYGVWTIGNNIDTSDLFPKTFLTACEWHWDEYYSEQILLCKQGKFKGAVRWLGIESGIVRLTPLENAGNASQACREPVEAAQKRFEEHTFDVFYGPIKDNKGNIRIAEGESMSDSNMLYNFDWYVEGVEIIDG